MNISPLIFSNNIRYRLLRHGLLWLSWIAYYSVFMAISWQYKMPFLKALPETIIEETLSIPMDMVFCYTIIYFLIPQFLRKGKYISMVLLWLLLSLLFVACFRWYADYVIPVIRNAYGLPGHIHSMSFIWYFFNLFSQINMEGCLAAAIKLGKMWFIKQQELDLVKAERNKIDYPIRDGSNPPVFLIHALDKLENLSLENNAAVPGIIQKIKKIFLYVMYDNNQPKVSLQKELELLKEYIELEKAGAQENIRITTRFPDNLSDEQIAPFLLMPLVDNSFHQLSLFALADKFIDLESTVSGGNFTLTIAWSKPVDTSTLANGSNAFLNTINKRLNLLYPQSHKLKVVIKTDQFIISLKINLDRAIN